MPRGKEKADAILGADSKQLDRDLKRARKKFKRFGGSIKRDMGRAFNSVRRAVTAGTVGALLVAGREVAKFEKKLKRLDIQAGERTTNSLGQMRDQIRAVSDATGVSKDDLLDGAAAFVSLTGDVDAAMIGMETFAKVSKASGASMSDITTTAAALQKNLKIDPKDFEQAFDTLLSQGKAGAIELKQLSGILSGIAPTAALFQGGTGTEGLAKLGAQLQIARKGFGSAEEAATGLQGLYGALLKNAKQFKKFGIQVEGKDAKTGEKILRDVNTIIGEIAANGKISDIKLLELLGRKEPFKAMLQLRDAAKGSNSELDKLSKGFLDTHAVSKDYADYQMSASGRMEVAIERVKNKVFELFTPERINSFADALEDVVDVVGFLVDNAESAVKVFAALTLASKFTPMLGALKSAGSLTMSLSSAAATSKLGIAGMVVQTLAFSAAVGTVLDDWLNLSDGIAGVRSQIRLTRQEQAVFELQAARKKKFKRFGEIADLEAEVQRLIDTEVKAERDAGAQGRVDSQRDLLVKAATSAAVQRGQSPEKAAAAALSPIIEAAIIKVATARAAANEGSAPARSTLADIELIAEALAGRPVLLQIENKVLGATVSSATASNDKARK